MADATARTDIEGGPYEPSQRQHSGWRNPDPDSSGAGFILGIIVAIIVIAALVYFLVLAPDNGGNTDGGTDGDGEVPCRAPSC